MKNITVSLDDEIYALARQCAAEQGTSVSRVVKEALVEFVRRSDRTRRAAAREALYARFDERFQGLAGDALYPGWRDDLYETAREASAGSAAKAA